MSSNTDKSVTSMIAYEGYMALMAWMDAHWTRHQNCETALRDTFKDFKKACDHEREALQKHQKVTGCASLSDFILKPIPFLALGAPDVLGITLLDDLDMAQWVMADTPRTIEEATVAFCLKPDPLLKEVPTLEGHLISMKDMVLQQDAGQGPPLLVLVRMKLEGFAMLMDPVETQSSVLRMIGIRLSQAWESLQKNQSKDGLLEPLDLGENSWRLALLDLQEEEEIGLLFACHNLSIPATLLGTLRGLKLEHLRGMCPRFEQLFQDYQMEAKAQEFLDLFSQDARKKAEENAAKTGQPLPCFDCEQELKPSLNACHVFRWTRSSVALHLDCFEGLSRGEADSLNRVRGACASLNLCQVPAGHSLPAAKMLKKARTMSQTDPAPPPSEPGAEKEPVKPSWQPCSLGNVDMLGGSLIANEEQIEGPIWLPDSAYEPTREVFQSLARLRQEISAAAEVNPQQNQECLGRWPTRHISGWATTLVVPMPQKLPAKDADAAGKPDLISDLADVKADHFPYLLSAISVVTRSFFREGGQSSDEIIHFLREKMQSSGMPVTLRRAFMVLFYKYLSLAAHPMRYEAVLDLYDTMQTLWDVLTKWLPQMHRETAKQTERQSVPRLPEKSVRFLFDFASAVEGAIDMRLRRLFPESPRHEWDLDFRGSMCQVIMAGETVLRAALGLVRRNVIGEKDSFHRLGVVNRMSVSAGIYHELSGLGVEKHARLSYVDTDVCHLTHIAQLADYFHEAFHLIHEEMQLKSTGNDEEGEEAAHADDDQKGNLCQNIRGQLSALINGLDTDETQEYLIEVSGELFVAMMMLLTVADGDEDLLWMYQASTFASSPKSAFAQGDTLRNTRANKTAVYENYWFAFCPLGILSSIIEALNREQPGGERLLAKGLKHKLGGGKLKTLCGANESRERFVNRCLEISELLPPDFPVRPPREGEEAASRLDHMAWTSTVLQEYDRAWSACIKDGIIDFLWNAAVEVAASFIGDVAKMNSADEELPAKWIQINEKMDALMKTAREDSHSPISPTDIFTLFGKPNSTVRPAQGTAFVVRALHCIWKDYLPNLKDKEKYPNRKWLLPRNMVSTDAGNDYEIKIEWETGNYEQNYHDFLVDTIRPEGFCIRPEKRAQRLRDQALFMKSFWGISYILRKRRLDILIEEYKRRTSQESPPSTDDGALSN